MYSAVFGAVLTAAWRVPARRVLYAAAGVCLAAILVWPLARAYVGSVPARGIRARRSRTSSGLASRTSRCTARCGKLRSALLR